MDGILQRHFVASEESLTSWLMRKNSFSSWLIISGLQRRATWRIHCGIWKTSPGLARPAHMIKSWKSAHGTTLAPWYTVSSNLYENMSDVCRCFYLNRTQKHNWWLWTFLKSMSLGGRTGRSCLAICSHLGTTPWCWWKQDLPFPA